MTSISFAVLGSGSRGNASILCCGEYRLLIDAGLSVKQTQLRLQSLGLCITDLNGIILTHLDRDHFSTGWANRQKRIPLPLYIAPGHLDAAIATGTCRRSLRMLDMTDANSMGPISTDCITVAHDDSGCTAFIFEFEGCRLGWATDIGHVPVNLLERFVDLDAVAIESNYDRTMQLESDRPDFLKERIMGGKGHLSNCESLEAIRTIADGSRLQKIVLLHLSRQCNHPDCVQRLWDDQAPDLSRHVVITNQHEPTTMLHVHDADRDRITPARPNELVDNAPS